MHMEQREYVPFPQVTGHEEIRRHLMAAVTSGRISHAYLFDGMEGVGRRTMARAFIQALLCTENKGRSEGCGHCVACRTVLDGNHPDVHWIRPEKGSGTIRVGQIRQELVQDMMVRPYQSAYKIYVIEKAELLGTEAQNAMLKTIEEPPAYGVVLLITNGASMLLPTIRSRCVALNFQPLPQTQIRQVLRERGFSEAQAAAGAAFSQGSLGQALALAGDEEFAALQETVGSLLAQQPEQTDGGRLEQAAALEKYKKDYPVVLDLMEMWYRDVMVWQQTEKAERLLMPDRQKAIARAASAYSTARLAELLHILRDIREKLDQNANYSLAMDCLLLALGKMK